MEVHHHPDLHHKPKKWKEYFLEFLMIFLAVTPYPSVQVHPKAIV